MFAPLPPPPPVPAPSSSDAVTPGRVTPDRVMRGDLAAWTPERLATLAVPPDALSDCREALVQNCRDCPDFRAAVGKLIEAGPAALARWAGELHGERFDAMLDELVAVARACGTPFADAVFLPDAPDAAVKNPLRPVVKRLSKRAKLRDAGGVTLPLIVGRSLAEWANVCTTSV